jgi:hypothetical protein
MREARQGRFTRHVRADARGKEGKMREARQSKCARQGRADARGKAGKTRGKGRADA